MRSKGVQPAPTVLRGFFDETYPSDAGGYTVVVGCWAAYSARVRSGAEMLQDLRRSSGQHILDRIDRFLEDVDGRALVTRASVGALVMRRGERDGTTDVPDMARTDNVWSHAVIFTVGQLLKKFITARQAFTTVDISHDPKSLTSAHRAAMAKTFRQTFVNTTNKFIRTYEVNAGQQIKIRRLTQVEKSVGGSMPSTDQLGTWTADRLCFHWEETRRRRFNRIRFQDVSYLVTKTVEQWDGKPFDSNVMPVV